MNLYMCGLHVLFACWCVCVVLCWFLRQKQKPHLFFFLCTYVQKKNAWIGVCEWWRSIWLFLRNEVCLRHISLGGGVGVGIKCLRLPCRTDASETHHLSAFPFNTKKHVPQLRCSYTAFTITISRENKTVSCARPDTRSCKGAFAGFSEVNCKFVCSLHRGLGTR